MSAISLTVFALWVAASLWAGQYSYTIGLIAVWATALQAGAEIARFECTNNHSG